MEVSQETVAKIQRFSQQRQKAEEEYGKQPLDSTTVQDYDQKLDETLKDLQDKLKHQDDDLQVCPPPPPKKKKKERDRSARGRKLTLELGYFEIN